MRLSEVFKLVWLNLSQNKSKAILTSVGIIVGTATIMLVIAIGTGGREEVAEQFKNLNAGSIDIEYDSSSSEEDSSGFGGFGGFGGGSSGGGGMPSGGGILVKIRFCIISSNSIWQVCKELLLEVLASTKDLCAMAPTLRIPNPFFRS